MRIKCTKKDVLGNIKMWNKSVVVEKQIEPVKKQFWSSWTFLKNKNQNNFSIQACAHDNTGCKQVREGCNYTISFTNMVIVFKLHFLSLWHCGIFQLVSSCELLFSGWGGHLFGLVCPLLSVFCWLPLVSLKLTPWGSINSFC